MYDYSLGSVGLWEIVWDKEGTERAEDYFCIQGKLLKWGWVFCT
jgi:hypothetical protein